MCLPYTYVERERERPRNRDRERGPERETRDFCLTVGQNEGLEIHIQKTEMGLCMNIYYS